MANRRCSKSVECNSSKVGIWFSARASFGRRPAGVTGAELVSAAVFMNLGIQGGITTIAMGVVLIQ